MDERLREIVDPTRVGRQNCVNRLLLGNRTIRRPLENAKYLNWERVKYLLIVQTKDWPEPIRDWLVDHRYDKVDAGCYLGNDGAWVLLSDLKTNQIQQYLNRCSAQLEYLLIAHTDVQELRLPAWRELRELHLIDNSELAAVSGLDALPSLEVLNLSNSHCGFLLDLTPFSMLRELILADSGIEGIRLLRVLESLRNCDLRDIKICDMEFLSKCPALQSLYLARNPISRLPEGIRQMKHLRRLQLDKLNLEELPDWLPELGLSIGTSSSYGIELWHTTVKDVDMSIFDQSQEIILDWFKRRKSEKEDKPLNEIKVVFLGDGSTGKSLTVARLLADGEKPEEFDGEATPGIAIEDRNFDLPDGRNVRVHFWDFGGQEILHTMHRIFLTERTLYVVMINARNNTQDMQARYWLHSISSFAPGCPVLLVLNQIDQNPNASINERSLRKQYPNLGEIVRLSALTYDREEFNTAFTEKMLAQIAKFKSLGTVFPAAWKKIMDELRGMEGNYIHGKEFREICQKNGVEGDKLRLDLLKWFHDLGVSFCCGKTRRLQDYVVLKPEWITNGIYTIIWNKRDDTANGMVDEDEIYRLLSPEAGEDVKKVNAKMEYKPEDVGFILDITRLFRLSFSMDDRKEFIPLLCNANDLPEADTFPEEPGVIEFRMEYDYLPVNVLHRLMVDMRQDLRTDRVWLTGALLRQKYNGIDAMVRSDDNALTIYIRAADAAHKAHTYLNTLRGALDAIHRDMHLKMPKMLVAYKEDGETEYFSYNKLEGARKDGHLTEYSEVFDKSIPIDDILNGSDSEVVFKHEKLLRDLAKACSQLQDSHLMFDTAEDNRNDTLRTALRNMGYTVSDQTHTGVGGTGVRAGSLDLQILHDANTVWTNLEALNLDSDSPTKLKYWENHLDRLVDNYNSAGLPNLFLISYVNCTDAQFHRFHSTYTEHMKTYAPPMGEPRRGTMTEVPVVPDGQRAWMRVTRCTYDMGGTPVMVYHYFVGFVKDRQKLT